MKPIIPVAMKAFSIDLDALRIPGVDAMQLFMYSCTKTFNFTSLSLREKCQYSEFFWSHSDWIRRDTENLSVLNSNAGK